MDEPSPMNAGEGKHSYAKNSSFQKSRLDATKGAIKEAIFESFDAVDDKQETSSAAGNHSSVTLRIADLGCSTGPNTFFAMQAIIEAIKSKCSSSSQELDFQVFFNDVNGNDFNTLFASLPKYWDRHQHYAAGVAGSFYGRLFPSSSIHVFNCFAALHWISKVPEDLLIRGSPTWNGGKIHYIGASEAVFNAYAAQFEKDADAFLKARAEETVSGGIVIICCPGTVDGTTNSAAGVIPFFLGSVLLEMVQEGLVKQDQVDTFNIPHVYPSVEQMTRLVEKNGCFSIEKIELRNPFANTKRDSGQLELGITHFRAVLEGTLTRHFGSETVNEMFERAFQRKQKLPELFGTLGTKGSNELFAVLKRK